MQITTINLRAMGMKAKSVNKFKALGMIDSIEEAFLTAARLDKKAHRNSICFSNAVFRITRNPWRK